MRFERKNEMEIQINDKVSFRVAPGGALAVAIERCFKGSPKAHIIVDKKDVETVMQEIKANGAWKDVVEARGLVIYDGKA